MTHRQVLEALSGILMGMFVSVLATSIVSSSLPRIIADLDGSQSAFTWVVTATLLTTTISTPIWGKLADLTDRKTLVQVALVITVVSSALAGFAQGTGTLITFRAFQGIGAGGLISLATVLVADIISPRERGKYMGFMGAVMAVGMIGGPLLGGALTDSVGWRWNFFVGVPFAVAAIVVLQRTLRLPPMPKRQVRLDYWGAALLSAGISGLLLWVTFAGNQFDWMSWQTAAMVVGSVVVLAVAVRVEARVEAPIIPLSLFRNRTLVLTVIASVAVGVAMFGTAVFLSQYMQVARGKSATMSGLLTIPMIVGQFLASTVSGQLISRSGRYKKFMVTGAVALTVGLALMGTIDYHTSMVLIGVYLFVLGAGVGMLMQNLVLATQNTLAVSEMGAGTSTVAFFRSLGGAVGVSVLGAVLGSRIASEMASGLAAAGIPAGQGTGTSIPDVNALPPALRDVVESAYGAGVADIFLVAAPIAVVALVAILFLEEVPLGLKSGVQQRIEDMDGASTADDVPDAAAVTGFAPGTAAAIDGRPSSR
ncbi:MDR family MFS transporter [Sanguibacter suaedae]|uniref:MFS transporter n=1 Tax=Sanguibacter suaedae TaxID=2795737 RepID=A0A934MBX9_9MICO|nr:MDR family MFS transporter [Sanguibacter suaedae]MBI9115796.1 MFS transporter [Sanguibacter suaedae]